MTGPTTACDCGHVKLHHRHQFGHGPCFIIGCQCEAFQTAPVDRKPPKVKTLDSLDPKMFEIAAP